MPVEAKTEASEIATGVLVKYEGMVSDTKACLEIAQQRVNQAELGQNIEVITTCEDGLMPAACRGYRAEASQAIGEHLTTRGTRLFIAQEQTASELNPENSKI